MLSVKCPRCEYVWITNSSLLFVTCPNCYSKFDKTKNEVKKPIIFQPDKKLKEIDDNGQNC